MASDADLLSLLTIAKVPVSINAAAFALDISPSEIRDISGRLEEGGDIIETGRGYALAPGKAVEVKPALAAFLAERLAQNLDAGPAVKGRLLLEAGKAEEAWSFLSQEALDSGHRRHDADRTEILALALQARDAAEIEGGEAEGRLRLQLAMLYRWAGRSEDSQREIEAAVRLLAGEELVNALGFAAAVADDRQHPQTAERWVAMAESVAATLNQPAKLGSLLTFHGRELSRLGFAAEANAALHRGEALLAEHGSMVQRFYGRLNRAWLEFDQGDVGKAEMDFAFLVDQAGSLEGEASLASNLASWARTLYATGQPERAREVAAQAAELAERSGSKAASMLVSMAGAEGALLFDRADEAVESADAALGVALDHLPAWENATRYLKARALSLADRTEEARTEVESALSATPAGGDGLRWRSRIQALQLDLADTWDPDRAADLADQLLQSGWFGAAVELLVARARRGHDRDLAAEAAALAMQLGNFVQAAKAIEAGGLWGDPLARSVAARLRTLPEGWEPALMSNPAVAIAMSTAEDEDDELLLSRIDQAMAAAGLSGDLILSPAQRRAAGLHRPRRRRRRSGWQLALGAAAVAVLAVGSAAVTINLLAPPTTLATATSAEVRATTTLVAAIHETQIPPSESRLNGVYPVRGGPGRAGLSTGGFREVAGYYWRDTPGGSIVTSAVAFGPYVYIGTDEDIVYGLEMQTGLLNMRVVSDAPIASELAVGQPVSGEGERSALILTFSTSEGIAYGYDALRSGSAIWQSPIGRSPGAPLLTEDKVVYATTEGMLHALALTSGSPLWTFDSGGESFVSGPTEVDGTIYAVSRDGLLYLVNAATGEPLCENPVRLTGSAVASPVVTGDAIFIGLESPPGVHVYGTGSCGVPTAGYAAFYPSSTAVRLGPAMTPETMYLIEERNLIALSLDPSLWTDPTVLPSPWESTFAADNLITTPPVLADDIVYVGTQDGLVLAADAATGTEAWRFETGSAIRGEIIVVPGAVLATTAQGEIVVIGGE
jgi:outer membrane protein assembly factor BamB